MYLGKHAYTVNEAYTKFPPNWAGNTFFLVPFEEHFSGRLFEFFIGMNAGGLVGRINPNHSLLELVRRRDSVQLPISVAENVLDSILYCGIGTYFEIWNPDTYNEAIATEIRQNQAYPPLYTKSSR